MSMSGQVKDQDPVDLDEEEATRAGHWWDEIKDDVRPGISSSSTDAPVNVDIGILIRESNAGSGITRWKYSAELLMMLWRCNYSETATFHFYFPMGCDMQQSF